MPEYPIRIKVPEAQKLMLTEAEPVTAEELELDMACDRVLACDIKAEESIPPFDRSPLDGYAVRSEDTAGASPESPVVLKIVEEVPAGYVAMKKTGKMEATKILTGAPLPEGADAVIKFEDTSFTEEEVRIFRSVKPGANIVKAGEDISAGSIILHKGDVLNPGRIGVLAGLGCKRITVYRKPLVRIISTGDELVDVKEKLSPGKIRNSSAYMLKAFLEKWGLDARIYGVVEDKKDQIENAIAECARDADCVITTGGASVGDYDFVLRSLEEIGARILFWRVQMKPGMATMAAKKDGVLLIGLSGNPSAAVAVLFAICLPVFRKMCGWSHFELPRFQVLLPEGFGKRSPNGRVVPGRLEIREGRPCMLVQQNQSNGMISPWGDCNLIGLIPKGTEVLEKNSIIDAYFLAT
ncbi:MAG: gephyrin-like molybdotransferase Glp [Agathobacter sp.]